MKVFSRVQFIGAIFILCISFLFLAESMTKNQTASSLPKTPVEKAHIIIDAGHGGKDGGAVAADGTQEQYLNLNIAKQLEAQLNALGMHTLMTRTNNQSIHNDHAVTIREQKVSDIRNRMKILNETENAILVSIHQNKFANSNFWGTQVFYSPNTIESPALATEIQKSVVSLLQKENHREIKKSDSSIYLLYHAKKPAVLVECGFVSNSKELKKLKDEVYQKQIAFSIAMGIINYLSV